MNKEELLTLFSEILAEDDIIKTGGIKEDNHSPHQFTVGSKHIREADKTNEGVLSEEICQKFKCAHKGCYLKYDEHKCDMELVLQLKQDITQEQAGEQLLKLQKAILEQGIKSVAFAEGEDGYKFI